MTIKRWLNIALVIIVVAGVAALLVRAYMQGRKELSLEKEGERPFRSAAVVSP